MKSPITGKEMKLTSRDEAIVFRKETFTILYHYYWDNENEVEFTDEAIDTLNLNQAYNQYREKHNLPFTDQIQSIREKYGLNQSKMAEVLGFGTNVYRQYENGEMPSISNARLIQLAEDAREFRKLVIASNALEGAALAALHKRIDQLIEENKRFQVNGLPQYLMTGDHNGKPGLYTGYKAPSLSKLIEMIVFFAGKVKPWKTKLNKLLFYADFTHFKKTGYSISGTEYYAIQMGPVPHNFSSIFEYAGTHGFIDIAYHEFQNGGIGEAFMPRPDKQFNADLFDDKEIESLEYIVNKVGKFSTEEIIRLSHEEIAWSENYVDKKRIPYNYAFSLKHA